MKLAMASAAVFVPIGRESGIETIEFRASAVLGRGSLSYEMIRSLTNRLPIMICPRWLATPTQPIAASDLVEYLVDAIYLSPGAQRCAIAMAANIPDKNAMADIIWKPKLIYLIVTPG